MRRWRVRSRGLRSGRVKSGHGFVARAVGEEFGGALGVEHRFAMLADGHAGAQLFAARRAFDRALRNVGPFAFELHEHDGAAVHVRNLAIGVAARPHFVGLGDELAKPSVANFARGGELLFGGAFSGANENAVLLEVLNDVLGMSRAEMVNGKR